MQKTNNSKKTESNSKDNTKEDYKKGKKNKIVSGEKHTFRIARPRYFVFSC